MKRKFGWLEKDNTATMDLAGTETQKPASLKIMTNIVKPATRCILPPETFIFVARLATGVWFAHKRLCLTIYLTDTGKQKPVSLNKEYCDNSCMLHSTI